MTTSTGHFPHRLAALLAGVRELHVLRANATRVDGAIVGTGKADFTVSNVSYQFGTLGGGFCLMDVPGIEGNESRYSDLVEEALAKAHAVFYVNGTNKKPEAETAAKISRYLHHDTIVHPILNVRGRADAYERESDRMSLRETHGDVEKNAALTEEVLRHAQHVGVVQPAILVQGMAALSAVALNGRDTTITPERADLIRAQKGMLQEFGNAEHLRSFSQIDQLRHLLLGYAEGGGRQAIVDANRRRIVRLVREALEQLDVTIEGNEGATATVSGNVDVQSGFIQRAVNDSEITFKRSAGVMIDGAFARLSEAIGGIVRQHFKSKQKANAEAERVTVAEMDQLRAQIQELAEGSMKQLSDDVQETLARLKADLANIQSASFKANKNTFVLSLGSALDAIDFQLTDAKKLLARMGSYAFTGATFGAAGGPLAAIAAGIGAVVGVFVELGMYFGFGREKKIREAQAKAFASLERSENEIKEDVFASIHLQYRGIWESLNQKVLTPLAREVDAMKFAGLTLARQRARIAAILEHIEEPAREPV